jgi:antitoxin (DNA-binding transcriptional repressor) of toxin-antitoxin stability system
MKIEISSTDAARNLGEYLSRVRLTGARFVIMKNRKPVAELGPVAGSSSGTLSEIFEAMSEVPPDDGFVEDLAAVNVSDRPLDNPWQ